MIQSLYIAMRRLVKKIWIKVCKSLYQYPKLNIIRYMMYPSVWHAWFCSLTENVNPNNYLFGRPNPFGAGIGHQMANWIAGYYYANYFGLRFAHYPMDSKDWDVYLGFGQGFPLVTTLLSSGYSLVYLPMFAENDTIAITLIKRIISSYNHRQVVFMLSQDQFYENLPTEAEFLQKQYYSASARQFDHIIYSPDNINVAIHMRRGDIMKGFLNKDDNLLMRFQSNNYFENVIDHLLKQISTTKPIHLYLFTQGDERQYDEMQKKYANLHLCISMNPFDAFTAFVNADILILSRSSFSYKPALLNKGIKIAPPNFWHSYPIREDWICCSENGDFILSI